MLRSRISSRKQIVGLNNIFLKSIFKFGGLNLKKFVKRSKKYQFPSADNVYLRIASNGIKQNFFFS